MAKSKTEKLLTALATGKEITAAQITSRFGLQNPSSTIHRLRETGDYRIFTNSKRDRDGYCYYAYRMAA